MHLASTSYVPLMHEFRTNCCPISARKALRNLSHPIGDSTVNKELRFGHHNVRKPLITAMVSWIPSISSIRSRLSGRNKVRSRMASEIRSHYAGFEGPTSRVEPEPRITTTVCTLGWRRAHYLTLLTVRTCRRTPGPRDRSECENDGMYSGYPS